MSDRGGVLGLFEELTGGGDEGTTTTGTGGDVAAAGNGGTSSASANGGTVVVGDVNSGGNSGSDISVGNVGTADQVVYDKYGHPVVVEGGDAAVAIDGGDVSNSTSLDISADGGTAISDASGGDNNFAFVS